jgi:hypothetical protein
VRTLADDFVSSTLDFEYDGSGAPVLRTTFAKRKATPSALGGRAKPVKKIKATVKDKTVQVFSSFEKVGL